MTGGSVLADTIGQRSADKRQKAALARSEALLGQNREEAGETFTGTLDATSADATSGDIESQRQAVVKRLSDVVLPQLLTGGTTRAESQPQVVQDRRAAASAGTEQAVRQNLAAVAALRGAANAEQGGAITRSGAGRQFARLGDFSRGSADVGRQSAAAAQFQRSPFSSLLSNAGMLTGFAGAAGLNPFGSSALSSMGTPGGLITAPSGQIRGFGLGRIGGGV